MNFIFLTKDFFNDHKDLKEIEIKNTRPYIMINVNINNIEFALPLRSGITHKHCYFTNKADNCGVDYSKSVIIDDEKYIDSKKPYIRSNEFKVLKGKDHIIKKRMEKYILDYMKAISKKHIREYNDLCRYSTLQNYHTEIGIVDAQEEAAATKEI
ncbi:MAG: hypothetical protein CVV02_05435 [Firmicutes bacterium HGW-Firmicutes-7]|nr:MAG: hypothetical protein CVV02_05435 [Firmicutes bacterium HGW-Firmicutes-7]